MNHFLKLIFVLLMTSTALGDSTGWPGSGASLPLTTSGDVLIRSGSTNVRLGIGSDGQVLTVSSGLPAWMSVSGTGDVVGPASATDLAITLFSGTTGKLVKNSLATIDGSGNITAVGQTLSGATASTVPYFDSSKKLTSSAVTPTQLGYVDFTSSGQTQMNLKAPLISPSFTTPSLGVATATSINGSTIPSSKTFVVTTDKVSVLAATSSSELAGIISDETGSGALTFANTPTLVTPIIGVATATSVNKVAITAPSTSATLTIADGKTATVSNTLTFSGTDSSSVAFGAGGTAAYTANKLSVFAATSSSELAGIISDETGSGGLCFANTPTLVTPVLGVATATSINKMAITAPASASTLAVADGKTFTVNNTLTIAGTDGNTQTFPSGSSTVMTLASADTITGVKTFGDGKLVLSGASSGASTLKAPAAASTYVHTLPAATTTLVGTDTTDTLSNKTLVAPALGTPVSGVATNITGLPIAGITGLGSGIGTWLATPSSANLITAITDETGSGALVFATSPALTTPTATQLDLLAQGPLRLQDSSGGEYVGFKAPATVTTYTLTMPAAVPGANQVLADSGSGNGTMAWVTAGGGTPTPTASTGAQWDANVNMSANNFLGGYASTVTAAGTTTLTVASAQTQVFTGSSTQTVVMPVASTLVLGQSFTIINYSSNSSGSITVQSSGGNAINVLGANQRMTLFCILTSGTGTASWDFSFPVVATGSGLGNNTVAVWSTAGVNAGNGNYQSLNSSSVTLSATPGTSAAARWDANLNLTAANFIPKYTTTATAAGTTTLLVGSNNQQYFTGSTTQTVKLPATNTLVTGMQYLIRNNSTGTVTLQANNASTIQAMAPNTQIIATCISTANTAGIVDWSISYSVTKASQTQISRLRSAATSLTTATTVNVANTTTKLTLPAGEWVIYGTCGFTAAATTTVSNLTCATSKTSATLPATDTYGVPTAGEYTAVEAFPALVLAGDFTLAMQPIPVSLTASTDYYLVGQGTFGVSTLSVYGSMYAVAQ